MHHNKDKHQTKQGFSGNYNYCLLKKKHLDIINLLQ